MKYCFLKFWVFKNKCLHSVLHLTTLQQINNYNTYITIIIQNHKNYEMLHCLVWRGHLYCCLHLCTHSCHRHILPHVEHILRCRIVTYFQFILDLRVSLPQFFITVNFFIIDHIYISLFLNATLGVCLLKHAGHPWGTFLLSGRIPRILVL